MILRLTLRRVGLGLAALALGGLLVGWSGVIYVGASGGHWAATEWFLHWVMRNSVRTRALALEAPDLSHPALLDRGAGHYATGCAPCHGAPGSGRTPSCRPRCRHRRNSPAASTNGHRRNCSASSSTGCATAACPPGWPSSGMTRSGPWSPSWRRCRR
ncbi:c-type cytochrome [Teichococcus aestuarii]|uniref:c-type cytochrome n=1 Tax=Teichococcus aestuarii TaxID=568898 RepID=UPI003622D427